MAYTDSTISKKTKIEISGYADLYYCYDFNRPRTKARQYFLYNHNRHHQIQVNLAFLKLYIEHPKYRISLAAHTGTYSRDNYASEPGLLKNIFEAWAGVSLTRKNNLWLDAGIFASHIGFESAVSMDNQTLTRSLLAENSPYYLSGIKLTYTPHPKWESVFLIVNGWQHIHITGGKSLPSFGTQVKFLPDSRTSLNWSTFIGTEDPDSSRRMRYFSNLYGQLQMTRQFGLTAGFDVGAQQQAAKSSKYHIWFSPVLILRYSISRQWGVALRGEYYYDAGGVIIMTGTANGFRTSGLSLNFDYRPVSMLLCRVEGRWLNSKDQIFETPSYTGQNNFCITASVAIRFNRLLSPTVL